MQLGSKILCKKKIFDLETRFRKVFDMASSGLRSPMTINNPSNILHLIILLITISLRTIGTYLDDYVRVNNIIKNNIMENNIVKNIFFRHEEAMLKTWQLLVYKSIIVCLQRILEPSSTFI